MNILSTRRQGVECDESRCVHGVYLRHFTASCNRFTGAANVCATRTIYCAATLCALVPHTLAHGGCNRTQNSSSDTGICLRLCHRLCRLIGKEFSICFGVRCSCDMFHDLCSAKFDYLLLTFFFSIHAMPFHSVRTVLFPFYWAILLRVFSNREYI